MILALIGKLNKPFEDNTKGFGKKTGSFPGNRTSFCPRRTPAAGSSGRWQAGCGVGFDEALMVSSPALVYP
jgi:hypothetical protein